MFKLNEPTYAVYSTAKNDEQNGFVYVDMGDICYSDLPKKSSVRTTKAEAKDLIDRHVFNLVAKLKKLKDELRTEKRDKDYRAWLKDDIKETKINLKLAETSWKVVKINMELT